MSQSGFIINGRAQATLLFSLYLSLLVNLYRISMQEIHISMEEVKNYYAGTHFT